MQQQEVKPLMTLTVATAAGDAWGDAVVDQIAEALLDTPLEQEDVFWVSVEFDRDPEALDVVISSEERFVKKVNKALGRELISWRVEVIYPQASDLGGLDGVLLLMNTVSLQDIMSFGA